ncbi:hypothetical protein N7492_003231 [Penicillium capsulatum]|uniref:Rab proteins geranylgeranyltransferase n=1 Tax=Penicillium capsulatum TaxID=69766 RepID=A0A9W9IMR5_9EURO|nr:hypothetical protein N7492_003231 [Penicillium capsulatum]KAJ6122182.1 hypothetical protein N7512_004647 [Penicillium capsulatum]
METLSETPWDVIIAGTGLSQSLLALALSRSGKKVLHLDQNKYYGGSEAAFSLDEAQEWVNSVNQHPGRSPFQDAVLSTSASENSEHPVKLASNRAYTLSLSPSFLYARSSLISILLSSRVFRQLEFMAVGNWWIHSTEQKNAENSDSGAARAFQRVPGKREDIFADTRIGMKSKRTLIRFLRHISKPMDEDSGEDDKDLSPPFPEYLSANFDVPQDLHNPLLSLSLSQLRQEETSASYAVSRIKRHLGSIGALGPGFGGVVSKYGCGAEILQVACRASAVGGGVYALDTGIASLEDGKPGSEDEYPVTVQLSNGESLRTKTVVGSVWDLSTQEQSLECTQVARSVSIVSSEFTSLFSGTMDGAPIPASVVVMFPGESLGNPQSPPVYLQVHSSDTGECPRQQSIIYGSVSLPRSQGQELLECAVDRLVQAEGPHAVVSWSMRYTQLGRLATDATQPSIQTHSPHVLSFPPPSLDLAFEDDTVDLVKQAWTHIVGDEVDHDDFMIFEDREGTSDE